MESRPTRRGVLIAAALAACTFAAFDLFTPGVSASAASDRQLAQLESKVAADREDLVTAAEYRQLAIATASFDRSIKLFERLVQGPSAGANAYLSLAFAYVDKVPSASAFRRLYLGRDAIDALTRAIERQPSDLAYLVRGLVNLYYDAAVFHRTGKAVADLEEARRLSTVHERLPFVARIYVALGDGYWRMRNPAKAREIWRDGLERFPENALLRARNSATDDIVRGLIAHSLDPDIRVDTSLRDVFPDGPAHNAVAAGR